MSKAKIISELLALVEECLSIEQEYQFAQARADAHRDKAIEGDVWERWLYCGAMLRMLELEERAYKIENQINEIEIAINMTE